MTGIGFDALTRRAAEAVSRRKSLFAIGAAALGIAAAPTATRAKDCDKKCDERCKKQKNHCEKAVEEFCAGSKDDVACENSCKPCCKELKDCKAGDATTCLLECTAAVIFPPA
jgi:hypothetical protein